MINQFKKTALMTLLFGVQHVYAGTMGPIEPPYNGIYIGADIGVSNLIDSTNTSYPITAHHLSATGIVGGGLIGYDYSINNLFKVGIEGFGNANGLNASNLQSYAPISAYRVSAKYNTGVRLLPGYNFGHNTIGHVILGYTNAQFSANDNGNYGYINQEFNQSGFQCGLGMKTVLIKNLSIRADALYSTLAIFT